MSNDFVIPNNYVMESFPEEFSLDNTETIIKEFATKSNELSDARQYIWDQYTQTVLKCEEFMIIDLKKYKRIIREIILGEIVKRFPYVGYPSDIEITIHKNKLSKKRKYCDYLLLCGQDYPDNSVPWNFWCESQDAQEYNEELKNETNKRLKLATDSNQNSADLFPIPWCGTTVPNTDPIPWCGTTVPNTNPVSNDDPFLKPWCGTTVPNHKSSKTTRFTKKLDSRFINTDSDKYIIALTHKFATEIDTYKWYIN
jgi:hypothetical protein